MKRTLLLTNLFWMLIVGSYFIHSCTQKPQESPKRTASSNPSEIVLDYSGKDFKSLPVATAEMMASNYAQNYLPLINKNLNNDDTRVNWFSLDELKNFIWQIEYHAVNAGVGVKSKDLGVRIYYAQYPKLEELRANASLKELNDAYAEKHTLFMVPTVYKDSIVMDFDPRLSYNNIKKGIDKEILPIAGNKNKNPNYRFIQNKDESTILNHGGLCPPGCPPPPTN